jgi:hypothetical protein
VRLRDSGDRIPHVDSALDFALNTDYLVLQEANVLLRQEIKIEMSNATKAEEHETVLMPFSNGLVRIGMGKYAGIPAISLSGAETASDSPPLVIMTFDTPESALNLIRSICLVVDFNAISALEASRDEPRSF